MNPPPEPTIRTDLRPGDLGYLTYLHGVLYAAERGWDHTFEAYVAKPLADFALQANPRSRLWIVESGARIVGSIAIAEVSSQQAQLRWFLVHPELRGFGVGRRLVQASISFCREQGYRSVFLWTVSGLDAARRLYEAAGFELSGQEIHERWGAPVTEQRFDLTLEPIANSRQSTNPD